MQAQESELAVPTVVDADSGHAVRYSVVKSKISAIFGGSSASLGAFGAFHNVCHYTCQGITAALTLVGISVVGMPLGFLLNPYLVVFFAVLGTASIGLSIWLELAAKRPTSAPPKFLLGGIWARRKLLVLAALGLVSLVSFISGVGGIYEQQGVSESSVSNSTVAHSRLTLGSAPRRTTDGGLTVVLTYKGIHQDGVVLAVVMETNNMNAPPLTDYDLAGSSYLVAGDVRMEPISWTVEEAGHMGHHVQGTLVFGPILDSLSRIKTLQIIVKDVAETKERVFSWEVISQ